MEKNRNALFFTCSLIEFIGRETKNRRSDIVEYLGTKDIQQIYNYSDIFHCEPIAKVADDFINKDRIENGDFDNIVKCKYAIPDYWDIGYLEKFMSDGYAMTDKEISLYLTIITL